jgi:hypothetical protein
VATSFLFADDSGKLNRNFLHLLSFYHARKRTLRFGSGDGTRA